MPLIRPDVPARLQRRVCLWCGYGGEALQGPTGRMVFRCPRCGNDLYARPARSYAELEGLVPEGSLDRLRASRPESKPDVSPRPGAIIAAGVSGLARLVARIGRLITCRGRVKR